MRTNGLFEFLGQFRKRGGLEVFFSGIGVKLISLVVSIIVARLLTREDYGLVSYAVVLISSILPFAGGGMDISLLRFGAIAIDDTEKKSLFNYTLLNGFLVSFVIVLVLLLTINLICRKQPDAILYLRILSTLVLTEFFVRIFQAYFRVHMQNRVYALMGVLRVLLLVFLVVFLVPLFGSIGYALALALAPLLACIFFIPQICSERISDISDFSFSKGEIWRFALLIGIGAIISRLQFYLDSIFVGNLLPDPESLAIYRIASLIPMSLFFLPTIFFNSEYVHITKNHDRKNFVFNYIKKYWVLAGGVCVVFVFLSQIFSEQIITLIFGIKYIDAAPLLKILIIGVCGLFLLRQPFGNLLNASGKAQLNVVNAVFSIAASFLLLMLMIPKYGLVGAAVSTSLSIWFSGFLGAGLYYVAVFRKLK